MSLDDGARPNQYALLGERRFAPYFWAQFLGAANDNLYKFALTVMLAYRLQLDWLPPAQAGLAIGALFIAPFVLFSATSGQLADKFDKARLIRALKVFEIAIVAVAAWGFAGERVSVLLACIFLMGLHSTLFGPVKYAYLPQKLAERELVGGNGMVEMGTFVAILLGNVAGGLLSALPAGTAAVSAACLALAVAGWLAALAVPATPAADAALAINWNPFSETWRNLRLAARDRVVFRSLLGISWMWFYGAVLLAVFPAFAKDVLAGDERVASLLLVAFSLGVGGGALACERLSRGRAALALVPIGAAGMSLFAADLCIAAAALPPPGGPLMTIGAFLAAPAHWRVIADLVLLAASAGLYSVPMYALIQLRSLPSHRARIIAANNILNAAFMVASALIVGALLDAGVTLVQLFGVLAGTNAVAATALVASTPAYRVGFRG